MEGRRKRERARELGGEGEGRMNEERIRLGGKGRGEEGGEKRKE